MERARLDVTLPKELAAPMNSRAGSLGCCLPTASVDH
jgi:hypothetical protein